MEKVAFDLLRGMERSWWYQGRARAIESIRVRGPHATRVLDYGAGFGGMHTVLAHDGATVYAYEPDASARAQCRERGYAEVFATESEAFAHSYDLICLFDVLEHIEDDVAFLERAKNALAPHGQLLISVPAFPFLWSVHDVEHQHHRRYTHRSLRARLTSAGYEVVAMSYWNFILFLPAAILRLLGRTGESGLALPPLLNALLYSLVRIEAWIMRFLPLPWGTGLVVLAKKSS